MLPMPQRISSKRSRMNDSVNSLDPLHERTSTGIQSIEIGISLLRILADARGALPLTAIAAAAGMALGKAHKYLASFIRSGLVIQSETGGRYDLGAFALDLGLAAMR